jgi:opacity protein-like surface antigen
MKNALLHSLLLLISIISSGTHADARTRHDNDVPLPVTVIAGPALNSIGLRAPAIDLRGSNLGFVVGAGVQAPLFDNFGIRVGLNITTAGGRLKYLSGYELSLHTTHIQVPLIITYDVVEKCQVGIGPLIQFGIGGHFKDKTTKEKAFTTEAGSYQLKRLNLGAQVVARYELNDKLSLGLSYTYGFSDMAKDNNVKIHHSELSAMVGYDIGSLFTKKKKKLDDNSVKVIKDPEPVVKKDTTPVCACQELSFVMNKPKTHMDAKVKLKTVKGVGAQAGTSHYVVDFDFIASLACSGVAGGNCSSNVYVTARLGAINASRKFLVEAPCSGGASTPLSWSIVSPSFKPAELAKKEYTVTYTIETLCAGKMKRQTYTVDLSGLGLTDPKWSPWTDVPDAESKTIQQDFEKRSR